MSVNKFTKIINFFSIFFIVLFFYLILLSSCKDKSINVPIIDNEKHSEDENYKRATKVINTSGGEINFGDGTNLNIPQGALNSDMEISIMKPKNRFDLGSAGYEMIFFDPPGMHFNKPVKMITKYKDYKNFSAENLQVFINDDGVWENVVILNINSSLKTIEFEINHFSNILIGYFDDLYLVLDVSGKYLKKGDLIYTLTSIPSSSGYFKWLPGHAGMFIYFDSQLQQEKIIESFTPKVRFNTLNEFKSLSDHLYLGARRYNGYLSEQDRKVIVEFADSKINLYNNLVGRESYSNYYSCTELTELAYRAADKEIVPVEHDLPFLLPFDQFNHTIPIDEITESYGNEISINVYGIVNGGRYYKKTKNDITIIGSPIPVNSYSFYESSAGSYKVFKWKPGKEDVGKSFKFTFNISASISGNIKSKSQDILLNIIEGNYPLIPSNPYPSDQSLYSKSSVTLTWDCSDIDNDPLKYDVYFGSSSSPPLVKNDLNNNSYDPGSLIMNTKYFWKITAKDNKNNSTEGPIWSFLTKLQINNPPNIPSNPIPQDQSTDQSTNLTLSWRCTDPENDPLTYDIYFSSSAGQLKAVFVDQKFPFYKPPSGLHYNTQYFWKIIAKDNFNNINESPVWTFWTVKEDNKPPEQPINPIPEDGAKEQALNIELTWSCADPENDPLTYDVYFGKNSPNLNFVSYNQNSNLFNPGALEKNSLYYWKVIARDNHGNIKDGPTWSFMTIFDEYYSFVDYFNNEDLNGWEFFKYSSGYHGDVINPNVINGRAILITRDRQKTLLLNGDKSWRNYALESDFKLEDTYDNGSNIFLIPFYINTIGYQSNGIFLYDSYTFQISGKNNQWLLIRNYSNSNQEYVYNTGNYDILMKVEYHIKIEIKENRIKIYLNQMDKSENLITDINITKDVLNGGRFGFGGIEDKISIDNIKIY